MAFFKVSTGRGPASGPLPDIELRVIKSPEKQEQNPDNNAQAGGSTLFPLFSNDICNIILDYAHSKNENLVSTCPSDVEVGYQVFGSGYVKIAFLAQVAMSNQTQVVEMMKKDWNLAFYKGLVIDHSKREFANISALQYCGWAFDTPMLYVLRNLIPKKQYPKVLAQLQELEDLGTEHGRHYNYLDLISSVNLPRDQQYVPAHVANIYCSEQNRKHGKSIQFPVENLPRIFEFEDNSGDPAQPKKVVWYPLSSENRPTEGLSVQFHELKQSANTHSYKPILSHKKRSEGNNAIILQSLFDTRVKQYQEFKESLDSLENKTSSCIVM